MGTVWAGEHEVSGQPVAIKIVRGDVEDQVRLRQAFRNEIRAISLLDHPNILRILDAGEIPSIAAISEERLLLAGSPYLVTERLPGQSLADWLAEPHPWAELSRVLDGVLAALAHAHARGLVHRDLKPGNILLDPFGEPRLADFGIAMLADGEGPLLSLGTPGYMAPEQFVPSWGPTSPATDLYALGCTLWALITGFPPFHGHEGNLKQAHLMEEPGALVPRMPLPVGMQEVLHRLLAKAPWARPQRAVEVAHLVRGLSMPEVTAVIATGTRLRSAPVPPAAQTTEDVEDNSQDLPPPEVGPGPPVSVVLPDDVPKSTEPAPAPRGQGLAGLRRIPLVGRSGEQQQLWSALRRVWAGDGPGAMILSGEPGTGKDRLARWLVETAHREAAAEVVEVLHGPSFSEEEGLAAMVRRMLGGGPEEELIQRAGRWLATQPPEIELSPGALVDLAVSAQFPEPRARYRVLSAALASIATHRPVVLYLRDVQWGADALGLARELLDGGPSRLLVVATVRSDLLEERPLEACRLRAVLDHPKTREVPVGGLPDEALHTLLQALSPTTGAHRDAVVTAAGGNPLMAVQLAACGIPPGQPGPQDLHGVWRRRLEVLLQGAHTSVHQALEVAAVLGLNVRGELWRAVLEAEEITAPRGLVERLLEERLATSIHSDPEVGWSFVHEMLRDVLLTSAHAQERLVAHHLACAGVLADHPRRGLDARRGRHLLEAGVPSEAAAVLLDGARWHVMRGEYEEARQLMELWDHAMELAEIGPESPRWADGWQQHRVVARACGDEEAVTRWAARIDEGCRAHGWGARTPLDPADPDPGEEPLS
ncbi:MAG TPA: hypothetical protein ENK18_07535 [Deltaproteobacteria bacterium]|nr:hypothetical protein [Deltaproteobacteria bacterium]